MVFKAKIRISIKQQFSFKNNKKRDYLQTLNQQVTGSTPVRLTIFEAI